MNVHLVVSANYLQFEGTQQHIICYKRVMIAFEQAMEVIGLVEE